MSIRQITRTSSVLLVLFLVACAGGPRTNAQLTQLEQRLDSAQDSAAVRTNAGLELKNAERHASRAAIELDKDGVTTRFSHEVYLANRWLDVAEAKASLAAARDRSETLASERDAAIVAARLNRAEMARLEAEARAELANQRASMSQAERDAFALQAEEEAMRAREARMDADQAEDDAMTARQARLETELRAEELAREAEAARLAAGNAEERAAAAQMAREAAEAENRRIRAELEQLQGELSELNARKTDRGLVLTLGDVLFDFDKATLRPGTERQLDTLSRFLSDHPERKVRIEGFTDNVGADAYNQQLSERRAEAVRRQLTRAGIDESRTLAFGYGEEFPVTSNESEAGRQQNRRVEIIISTDDEDISERRR